MKNKQKLLIGIIIVLIAVGGFYFRENITGFSTTESIFDNINLDELPDTDNRLLESPVQATESAPGRGDWTLHQKYVIGEDGECIKDCISSCKGDSLEVYKAYVQQYGTCMCKCLAN
jgi:hypothetical protein